LPILHEEELHKFVSSFLIGNHSLARNGKGLRRIFFELGSLDEKASVSG
jgi:hypothetical protein